MDVNDKNNASMAGKQPQKEVKVPVIEEQVDISKKTVERKAGTLTKSVSEEEVIVDIPLNKENIEVERVPVNQYVDEPPVVRFDGDTTIIPVLKEVVEKRLILVEEVHVTKNVSQTREQHKVHLKKEEVNFERK